MINSNFLRIKTNLLNLRNAGIIEGKFLEYSQDRKPGSSIDNPEYYTPADFAIGATIEVFSRKFKIVGACNRVALFSIASFVPHYVIAKIYFHTGVYCAQPFARVVMATKVIKYKIHNRSGGLHHLATTTSYKCIDAVMYITFSSCCTLRL